MLYVCGGCATANLSFHAPRDIGATESKCNESRS